MVDNKIIAITDTCLTGMADNKSFTQQIGRFIIQIYNSDSYGITVNGWMNETLSII